MSTRSRTQTAVGAQGTYYKYFFGTVYQGVVNVPGFTATCVDVVGNRIGENPLAIDKVTFKVVPVTSVVDGGPDYKLNFKDFTPSYYRSATFGHLTLPSVSNAADVTKVFARTNPSRATVDAPAAVAELRELPAFLYQAGRALLKNGVKNTLVLDPGFVKGDLNVIPKGVANGYLAYEYGWKPFLSDLKKLLDFQAHVLKRERELHRLHEKGGLSRKFQISSDVVTSLNTNIFVESFLFQMQSTHYSMTTTRRRWGSARWLPSLADHPVTDAELHKQAVRAVYGLSLSPRSAWELIPWSWLIDWCSDVGDYLEANRNTVGATCAGALLMEHTQTIHRFRKMVHGLPGRSDMGEADIIVDTKRRTPYTSPILFSDIPNLGFRKQSILGAIGVQRTAGLPTSRRIFR